MRLSIIGLALAGQALSHNIVISNDNGFADYTIRHMYHTLVEDNHTVILSAPTHDMSRKHYDDKAKGKEAHFGPPSGDLIPVQPFEGEYACAFNACQKGAEPVGVDSDDPNIHYLNAPAATCLETGIQEYGNALGFDKRFDEAGNPVPGPIALIGPDVGKLIIGREGRHSGVIAAAERAAWTGVTTIAVSAAAGKVVSWDTASPPPTAEVQVQITKMILDAVVARMTPYPDTAHPGSWVFPSALLPGTFLSVNIGGHGGKGRHISGNGQYCELKDYKFYWTALQKYDIVDDSTASHGHPMGGPICRHRDKDPDKTTLMSENDLWDKGGDHNKCKVSISMAWHAGIPPDHEEVLDTFNLISSAMPVDVTPFCGRWLGHGSFWDWDAHFGDDD